jgi:hypothetical protein
MHEIMHLKMPKYALKTSTYALKNLKCQKIKSRNFE